MRRRNIHTLEDLNRAITDLPRLANHLPVVLTISVGSRIRSPEANSRYWVSLTHHLDNISNWVQKLSDETGHTPWEIREVIASELPPEHKGIMYAFIPKAAHVILKMICNVPTTTDMGSKEFSKYELRMEQTMTDIVGTIQSVAETMEATV